MHFEDARLKLLEQIADEGVQTELWLAVIKLEMFVGEVNFSLQLEDSGISSPAEPVPVFHGSLDNGSAP